MASLEHTELARLRDCLDACSDSLLVAGLNDQVSPELSLNGTLGVIDWRVHGHVSRILARKDESDFHLIPSQNRLGKATLLVLRQNSTSVLQKLPKVLQKLQTQQVCLAESTFAEKELQKLHESLRKAQVSWNRLESLT